MKNGPLGFKSLLANIVHSIPSVLRSEILLNGHETLYVVIASYLHISEDNNKDKV